ncbi:MAG TPA: chaperone modulator CbpM [Oxalicibacterium sp.]|jgi:chaperone modulatory protein CbpM|nr:chaperone modulator CbpM [Oxalicibacterium sp.]
MNTIVYTESQLIDDDVSLTLVELCRVCRGSEDMMHALVMEGVLQPSGQQPQEWRFSGAALRRARLAQRLAEDLEINTAGVALALDLLDQIDTLKAELARRGSY